MIRIVLAEDHKIVRQGFRSILESEFDLEIVGETGEGLDAVRLVEEHEPDLLVVDLALPELDGLEISRRVKKRVPKTRIIVLSMHADEGYVVSALRSGASAYVLKDAGSDELLHAVRRVLDGHTYLSTALPRDDILEMVNRTDEKVGDRYDTLTDREREILQLIAEGFSSPEIGEKLFISPRTVDTHRANIIAKLGLDGVPDLIRFAVERGLIPPRHGPRRHDP